ncbi:DUF1036 domain-containing protein [Desulfovibrio sp. OttesenSCG-928-C14]|nr:DUF1036 domain-containing protein [Desulfovibrio sp. OttesenSCG-928-C14]
MEAQQERLLELEQADESKGFFVRGEFGGKEFLDSDAGEKTVSRWVRNEPFTIATRDKPSEGTNLRIVTFHQCLPPEDEEDVAYYCFDTSPQAAVTEFLVRNSFTNPVDMAVIYYDSKEGSFVTRGWFKVEANKERKLKFENVEPKSGVYFHAEYQGTQYSDKQGDSKAYNRWVSNSTFKYLGDKKPTEGKGVRTTAFYKARYSDADQAFIYNVNNVVSRPAPKPAPAPKAASGSGGGQSPQVSMSLSPDELLIGGRMSTDINFTLDRDCFVTITLYDEDGRLVERILHNPGNTLGASLKKGSHSRSFRARDLDYGDYSVVLEAQRNFKKTKVSKRLSVILRR